ncbi:MAG: hypothetical protein HYX89_08580, partial [Chloroflexi bacterium]|nr:hypothetical protein [Chloroflexota bacterium]
KLYFMIGLPTETEEDIDELIRLSTAIHRRTQSFGKGSRAVVNISHFVPKAQTPFQWADMAEEWLLADRLARIRSALQGVGIEVRTDSIDWAAIEGLLARGDQRLAPVLAALERNTVTTWKRTLAEYGIDRRQYLNGRREDAPLPWDVVATGVRQPFLLREWQRALAESPKILPTCPPSPKCRLCGVCTPDHAPVRVPLLVR